MTVFKAVRALAPLATGLAIALACVFGPSPASAEGSDGAAPPAPIVSRNIGISRVGSAEAPRSEHDQALSDGWPLYRSERGQRAFNDAMATLKATEGSAPAGETFKGCRLLLCNITLPAISDDGWLPAGRIWVSPSEYVLIAHSHRNEDGQPYRRRSKGSMKVFVLHEFQSSSFNTDTYDTISSHARSVFVPLYMSKEHTDARGRRFVVVVQVAPYDVVSRHATNWGHAGPGIEVAKNTRDVLEPLQSLAGIVVTTMIKDAAPHLRVVHHRGFEGLPMLRAYERRLAKLKSGSSTTALALPFVAARRDDVALATARIDDLMVRKAVSAPIPIAERAIVPPKAVLAAAAADLAGEESENGVPRLVGPIRPAVRPAVPQPVLVGPILQARRPTFMLGGVHHP